MGRLKQTSCPRLGNTEMMQVRFESGLLLISRGLNTLIQGCQDVEEAVIKYWGSWSGGCRAVAVEQSRLYCWGCLVWDRAGRRGMCEYAWWGRGGPFALQLLRSAEQLSSPGEWISQLFALLLAHLALPHPPRARRGAREAAGQSFAGLWRGAPLPFTCPSNPCG